jgi:uncharacterized membrane protein (DUF485 family)
MIRSGRRIPQRRSGEDGVGDALFVFSLRREKVSTEIYARIRQNPRFAELVEKRTRFAAILAAVVLVVFYSFILLVAFAPDLIGKRLFDGSNWTFGVVAGLLQFIIFWVLTLVYVRRANGEFDDINKEIIQAAWEAKK